MAGEEGVPGCASYGPLRTLGHRSRGAGALSLPVHHMVAASQVVHDLRRGGGGGALGAPGRDG